MKCRWRGVQVGQERCESESTYIAEAAAICVGGGESWVTFGDEDLDIHGGAGLREINVDRAMKSPGREKAYCKYRRYTANFRISFWRSKSFTFFGVIFTLDSAPLGDDSEPRSKGERFPDAERSGAYAASGDEFCVYEQMGSNQPRRYKLNFSITECQRGVEVTKPGAERPSRNEAGALLAIPEPWKLWTRSNGRSSIILSYVILVITSLGKMHDKAAYKVRRTFRRGHTQRSPTQSTNHGGPSAHLRTRSTSCPSNPIVEPHRILLITEQQHKEASSATLRAGVLVRQSRWQATRNKEDINCRTRSQQELAVLEVSSSKEGGIHNSVGCRASGCEAPSPRPKSEMHLKIYIALYNTEGGEGKYHWALVTREPQHKLSEPVCEYQVVKKKKWESQHASGARLGPALLCLIEMPSLEASAKEVDAFIWQQPAGQGPSGLLRGQKAWSSAHWVIRTLDGMAERRWFEEPVGDQTDFYDYIASVKGRNCEQGVAAGPEFAHAYVAHMGVEVDGIRFELRLEEKENATAAIRRHLQFRLQRKSEKHGAIDRVLVEQHRCDARRAWMEIVSRQKKIVWDWRTEGEIKKRLGLTREDMLKNRVGAVRTLKMSSAAIDAARASACMVPPRPPPPKFVPGLLPELPAMILVIPNPIALFSCSPRTMGGRFEKAAELAVGYQVEYCGLNRTKARQRAEEAFLASMKALGFEAEDWERNAKRRLNGTYREMVGEQERRLAGVEDRERCMAEFRKRAVTSVKQTFEDERSRRVA
ncbi:hypothetical protein IW261DRAFT_1596272, partial [Armillaria novae-zelandiae]